MELTLSALQHQNQQKPLPAHKVGLGKTTTEAETDERRETSASIPINKITLL